MNLLQHTSQVTEMKNLHHRSVSQLAGFWSYKAFPPYGFYCEYRDMAYDRMRLGILCTGKVVLGLDK